MRILKPRERDQCEAGSHDREGRWEVGEVAPLSEALLRHYRAHWKDHAAEYKDYRLQVWGSDPTDGKPLVQSERLYEDVKRLVQAGKREEEIAALLHVKPEIINDLYDGLFWFEGIRGP